MITLDPGRFNEQFEKFKSRVPIHNNGQAFTNFREGVVAAWEGYKIDLRDRALGILVPDTWTEAEIGSGAILQRTITAIEIQDGDLTNNLVFWQNRYGPDSRNHRVLLEAVSNNKMCKDLEQCLFDLYRGNSDEGAIFDYLSRLTGARYPLISYLYFLKDMDRFAPILPTTFDRAFRDIGIDLVTVRNCSWENYQRFITALGEVRKSLVAMDGLAGVRLIDAHSFCWILQRQLSSDPREKSIIAMRRSVEKGARDANEQIVERIVKNKELRMTQAELEDLLWSLLDTQNNRCALTGIRFDFAEVGADENLRPSVDRIDSNGHYEGGNLQIVCQFINFWKGDTDNDDFKRLLRFVWREGAELASHKPSLLDLRS